MEIIFFLDSTLSRRIDCLKTWFIRPFTNDATLTVVNYRSYSSAYEEKGIHSFDES